MKKLFGFGFAALLLVGPCQVRSNAGQPVSGTIIDKTTQPVGFVQDVDTIDLDRFSLQAVYSNGAPAASTVTDGVKATLTITLNTSTTSMHGATITINGVSIAEGGGAWTCITSSNACAKSLSNAITANSSLNTLMTSTHGLTNSLVVATAAAVGAITYTVAVTTPAISVPAGGFVGGVAPNVDATSNAITSVAHGFTTGLKVLYSSTTVTSGIGGLQGGTTYFTIRTDADTYSLATTSTTAAAGTAVDVTTLPGGQTFTVTPLAFSAGSAGFSWQASNDGTNFANLSITSITYSGTAGNTVWDFASNNYRYLRLNFVAPTNGGVNLAVKLNGQKRN